MLLPTHSYLDLARAVFWLFRGAGKVLRLWKLLLFNFRSFPSLLLLIPPLWTHNLQFLPINAFVLFLLAVLILLMAPWWFDIAPAIEYWRIN
jgi:hypothetical protein